ncbi:MAG: 3-dehydroquinate synthase [Sinobacteraceae bacterium]|nr:3-dehydroquinate synthase [Nevskiaceae bacterium]
MRIGAGLLADPAAYAPLRGRPLRVLTDAQVAAHYLEPVLRNLELPADAALVLPPGEAQKTWDNAGRVLDWLLAARLPRDGALLALGGGVIGDLAGFCAAVYQRGIDLVQLPTTLLAQVDSSVGGKTGVNHARGKNLIGAFHQPCLVLADTETLRTLPPRELAAGAAEVIKCALLGDAPLFARLERRLERVLALEAEALGEAIERSVTLKARIVAADERESLDGGARALLNLGHTFGHAVETYTRYATWLHGEAVGLGLCMAADLSARLGWLTADDARRVRALVERAGLPTRAPAGMTPEDFRRLMAGDKKVAGGRLRLVLLRALGEACVTADFDPAALDATLEHFCAPGCRVS